jgi:hypothetical protein
MMIVGSPPDESSWRKSQRSTGNGECVEVALSSEVVSVRDSKHPEGPIVRYPKGTWRSFLANAKLGGFDVFRLLWTFMGEGRLNCARTCDVGVALCLAKKVVKSMTYMIVPFALGALLICLAAVGMALDYDVEITFRPPIYFKVKITRARQP